MEQFKQIQDLVSPKFTWEVFETVLKKQSNSDKVKLINITLGSETSKGDSYLSTVTRFSVDYTGENNGDSKPFKLHVFGKSLLRNVARRNTYRNSDFFANEIVFYEEIWPKLDAFQKEFNALKTIQLYDEIPNYLCGEFDGSNDYMLLEDLSYQGYQSASRSDALTFERAKLVLKVLSKYHALGYAFKELHPESFQETASKLRETYFHDDFRGWYAKFQHNLSIITLDAVEKELPEVYGNRLKEIFARDYYGEAVALCAPSAKTNFKTIAHGDTWMPNLLIRFDEKKQPVHSVLIDFQLARYATVAQDLLFFTYACIDEDLRANHREDLIKYYCQEFSAFFAQFVPENPNVLTYDAMAKEMKANGMFAFNMTMEAIIMSLLDDHEVPDLDEMQGEEAVPLEIALSIVTLLKTKEKRLKVANIFKHMMDLNYV